MASSVVAQPVVALTQLVSSVAEWQTPTLDDEETSSLYVEIFVVLVLIIGFSLWGRWATPSKNKKAGDFRETSRVNSTWCKAIEEKGSSGDYKAVLKIWNPCKSGGSLGQSAFSHVVKALMQQEPDRFIEEMADQLAAHMRLRDPQAAGAIVDTVANAGHIELMEDLVQLMDSNFGIQTTVQMHEAMAGAYAYDGELQKLEDRMSILRNGERKASARCHCNVLRGLLQCREADAALQSAKEMKVLGYSISPYLVTDLYRIFCKAGRAPQVMKLALPEIPPSSHAAVMLLEHCVEKKDLALAKQLQISFENESTELCPRAHETMLKVLAGCGDELSFPQFEKMKALPYSMSEGFYMSLLTKCAESKFLTFADTVAAHVRTSLAMTVPLYSAHMKVYAAAELFDKACDIYEQMRQEGLEPDAAMYSPVAWYASECGRHELSKQLADQSPQFRAHRWMSSIRSCVKDKNVHKAMEYLAQALALGNKDTMIFNCTLDVCAAAGNVEKARELISLMHKHSKPDVVTYNTALKCYSLRGDLRGAKSMLREMEAAGVVPNEVSYNVIVNMAVTHGSFSSAWDTIETMTGKGISVDCYTISTLLKAVKKSNSLQDLNKVLALMDRLKIRVSNDEVLMNCVLEMCMRHRLSQRMESIVGSITLEAMKPSPHTYATLFRACSQLKNFKRCNAMWDEMVNVRGVEPSKVTLTAMIEVLCASGRGDKACALMEQWKEIVPPTMPMYHLLPHGFPQTQRGVPLAQEFRKAKLTMTTMLYNFFIDVEAKAGNVDALAQLVEMLHEDGCTPDNFTVSLQVKGYCYSGELKKAFDVFNEARELNLKGDTVAFNTLLDGCIRCNDYVLADSLVGSIDDYGVVPSNFTVGTIIKMWGRRRQLEKCFETAAEFCQRYGIVASGPVRACLLSACVLNRDADRAFKVLNEIRQGREGLDSKALGSVITLCLRINRLDGAVELLDEVGTLSSSTDVATDILDQTANALSKAGLMETVGLPLFQRLRLKGVSVAASSPCAALLRQ